MSKAIDIIKGLFGIVLATTLCSFGIMGCWLVFLIVWRVMGYWIFPAFLALCGAWWIWDAKLSESEVGGEKYRHISWGRICTLTWERRLMIIVIIAIPLTFMVSVWPTIYRYDTHNGETYRTNRFTGSVQQIENSEWSQRHQ